MFYKKVKYTHWLYGIKENIFILQRGNPLLKHIRNVPYEFGEVVPDYVMGATTCAIFLSLRYHRLNPQYIHERLKILGQQYQLRVLLLQVRIMVKCIQL